MAKHYFFISINWYNILSHQSQGVGNSKIPLFCENKAKLSQKEKIVSYQGKPAATMENKEGAERGWRREAANAAENPGEALQMASPEQKESQKHQQAKRS